jgi:hypothetical protein
MRSIEYLAQLFPEKTGKELFEIQVEDKRQDELKYQEANKECLAIVDDIKTNGGYFKGAFGTEQYYMYKVTNIEFDGKQVYCVCDEIVLFDSQNIDRGVLKRDSINFEIQTEKYIKFDDITLMSIRIKEEEYNELKNYLFGVVPKFFKEEWDLRQKEFGRN